MVGVDSEGAAREHVFEDIVGGAVGDFNLRKWGRNRGIDSVTIAGRG